MFFPGQVKSAPPPPITAVLPAASGLFLEENTADLTRS